MNILFCVENSFNYLSDIIFHGLSSLGHRVIDYPGKSSYHGHNHDPHDVGRSSLCFNFPTYEYQEPYDLVLVSSHYGGTIPYSNFYVIDGDDYQYINEDYYSRCQLYFKREVTQNILDTRPKCRPLSFAAIHTEPYIENKSISFSFVLSGTTSNRDNYYQALLNCQHEFTNHVLHYRYGDLYPVSYDEYCNILRNSLASVSVKGIGEDTYRYWEICAYSCALFARKSDTIVLNDYDDSECIRCDNEHVLLDKLRYYARDNPGELGDIRRRGYDKLMNYHTSAKRAEYLLGCI